MDKLQEFIKNKKSQGFSEQQIYEHLVAQGYDKREIKTIIINSACSDKNKLESGKIRLIIVSAVVLIMIAIAAIYQLAPSIFHNSHSTQVHTNASQSILNTALENISFNNTNQTIQPNTENPENTNTALENSSFNNTNQTIQPNTENPENTILNDETIAGSASTKNKTTDLNSCIHKLGTVCESFEVCKGQKLSASDTDRCCKGTCMLPKSFDWRNRHGENWNTPVRDQGATSACTIFGPIAQTEAAINLYFNQHLDIDLSEQSIASCGAELYHIDAANNINVNKCFNIQSPASLLCYAKFFGIVDEACYPQLSEISQDFYNCINLCPDYNSRLWKTADFSDLLSPDSFTEFLLDENNQVVYSGPLLDRLNQERLTVDLLKTNIIRYGPVSASEVLPGHTAAIVGWNTWDYELNEFCDGNKSICSTNGCTSSCIPDEIICMNYYDVGNTNIKGVQAKCGNGTAINLSAGYNFCGENELCYNKECVPRTSLSKNNLVCISKDFINNPSNSHLYIPSNGETIWIVKDSGGYSSGDNGYKYIMQNIEDFHAIGVIKTPIFPPKNSNYNIRCEDKDSDTFCNWGISATKPSTCSISCKSEEDWDDSNNEIGALGTY